MPGFAVVDLETTGFSPRLGDRVAEVAVVLVDDAGRVEDEWSTLVNPERDLGPQHVHGIAAADVALAPTFDRVAPALLRLLAGRVLVAHNAAFDTRFLRAEIGRAGIAAAIDPVACLCTQQLASRYLTGSRALAACCAAVGVVHDGVHSALGDARATAGLLGYYLDVAGDDECWAVARAAADGVRWSLPAALPGAEPVLRGASRARGHWLAALADAPADPGLDAPGAPAPGAGAGADGHHDVSMYLRLLDDALLDRYVSHAERAALLAEARHAGLDRATVEAVHRDYLAALARAELDALDGTTAAGDRDDGAALRDDPALHEVAGQLGLDADDVAGAVEAALGTRLVDAVADAGAPGAAAPGAALLGTTVPTRPAFVLAPDDEVVLTGSMSRSREAWERDVRAAGLSPWPYVTRRTRLLVAADPDSLSTKARTARRYGVPVVTEAAFARLLAAREGASGRTPEPGVRRWAS
ncbi:DNA polymerase III subunit epsilon [Cellulosimicrobium cellulans]|uniref:exonuclease domain-containing protein n=1 Tax=Cellulosimicrobium cellulans TaxID=1710 RepID=UPI00188373C9|nr:exonuclease domain-containing protein [Cellulosimicrobium cellulans]MBE9925631.1 DNA polymerase III subunit epsilon [Cellulosimicrobium cellulans]